MRQVCQVCQVTLTQVTLTEAGTLNLHHDSYAGAALDEEMRRWKTQEADDGLAPMCRQYHQQLHQMMDGRKKFCGWDRRCATVVIIGWLVSRLHEMEGNNNVTPQHADRLLSGAWDENSSQVNECELCSRL